MTRAINSFFMLLTKTLQQFSSQVAGLSRDTIHQFGISQSLSLQSSVPSSCPGIREPSPSGLKGCHSPRRNPALTPRGGRWPLGPLGFAVAFCPLGPYYAPMAEKSATEVPRD